MATVKAFLCNCSSKC